MKIFVAVTAMLLLVSCTSVQEVVQDAGELRSVAKESIGRQVEGVSWRDNAILDNHRQRHDNLMRLADEAARNGDIETAEQYWDKDLENLTRFDPVGTKVENIRRALGKIRTVEQEEATDTVKR